MTKKLLHKNLKHKRANDVDRTEAFLKNKTKKYELTSSTKKSSTHKRVIHKPILHKHVVHTKLHHASRFCPNCGNVLTPKDKILCKDCKKVDFSFKDIKIVLCNSCSSYFYKNKWARYSDLNIITRNIAQESIKEKVNILDLDNNLYENILSFKAGVKKSFSIEVELKGEHFDIPFVVEVTLCPKCSKKGTKYFESVLQVRNANAEIMEFARKDIAKQETKGVHLNKETRVDKYSDDNVDFYLTNNKYALILAEKLRKTYGGTIKKNAKLFSIDWETSKNLYRLNVLIELPKYAKGEVIKIDDALYLITSIAEKIHVQNLKAKSKTSLPIKDSYTILKPVIFQVTKKYPEYEVLDPNTYYQARLMNPTDDLEINQKINVIIDGSEAWMV